MDERYAPIQEMFRKLLHREEEKSNNDADEYWIKSEEESDDLAKAELLANGMAEGSALCAQELGKMCLEGRGISKDLENAKGCFDMAAACGLPIAMLHLGLLEIKEGNVRGLDWICKSVIYGDVTAYQYLKNFISSEAELRQGVELRLSVYYEEVHDKKDASARENQFMGWCYATGICCAQDFEQAQARWIIGIGQESFGCQYLMKMYKNGEFPRVAPKNQNTGYQKGEIPEYDELVERLDEAGSLEELERQEEERERQEKEQEQAKRNANLKAILSIVIGLVAAGSLAGVSLIGLILGILALKDKKGALAVIGIVINAIVLLVLASG